jgi:integrase
VIALYTGRRAEAILSLQWRAIDLRSGLIDFRRPGQAAAKKRRGRCRIPDRLLPHLERAARFGHDVGPVINWADKPIKNIRKAFETAARRAGIDNINCHVLKHTAAISWAIDLLPFLPSFMSRVCSGYAPSQGELQTRLG